MARIVKGGAGPAAVASAADRLDEARAQAEALLAAAREQAARIQEEAREARAAEEQRAAEARAERERAGVEQEREIVGLALAVAGRVLEVAVEDPRAALESARRALRRASGQDRVTLRCHPADEAPLRAAAAGLRAPGCAAPEIRAGPEVGRGGVLLEAEGGVVDARIESQLRVLARELGEAA